MTFLSLSFIFPLLLMGHIFPSWRQVKTPTYQTSAPTYTKNTLVLLFSFLFVLLSLHYLRGAYDSYLDYGAMTGRRYQLKDQWLFPLKDPAYSLRNGNADFPYRVMHSGERLYLADRAHPCLNADLACTTWINIDIEMRGDRLEEGFKSSHSELWKTLPYLR
jgi:hypothetical protein